MSESFDLRTEPWIPVITRDGARQDVGLRNLLLNAHDFVHIDTEYPLFKASIVRILVAILHRALDGPTGIGELDRILKLTKFPAETVNEYLDKWSDRFDLFHATHPFYQSAGLVVTDKAGNENADSIKVLLPDIAVGNNKTLFDHSVDNDRVELAPPAAARALVAAQCFSLGGLARKYSNHFGYRQNYYHAPLVAGMPTIALGETLFETLTLNLLTEQYRNVVPTMNSQKDVPVWERGGEDRDGEVTPHGYLDYLTTQSRHIRLVPEQRDGRVIVGRLHRTQGIAPRGLSEPWFFYKESRSKKNEYHAPQLDPDRSVWRDCDALLAIAHKEDGKRDDRRPLPLQQLANLGVKTGLVRCEILSLANDRATPLYWRDIPIRFPQSLLANENLMSALRNALQVAESVDGALHTAAYRYAAILLGENPDQQDVRRVAESTGVSRDYWASLDMPFRNLVAQIDTETWAADWARDLRNAAGRSLETCLLATAPGNARGYQASAAASGIVFHQLKKSLAAYENSTAA